MAVAALLATGACSSKKQAARPGKEVVGRRTPQVRSLGATYRPWTSVYAPVSLKLSKPSSFGLSGRATMVQGEYIHISLRVLGIEAGVVYIDTDSAFIIDKFHKVAVAAPFKAITAATSITLADLQGILLGQAVYPGSGAISDDRKVEQLFSSSTSEEGATLLTPRRTPGGCTWYYTIDSTPALTKLDITIDSGGSVTALFSDPAETDAGLVAGDIAINALLGKQNFAASLSWDMGKAQWDSSRAASRPSLDGYRIMSASQLLKGLKL